ncbi:predicted protein [Sclerotinia sclerotiorum 1980 UF-70]|uniref:Uncharacterized protein n=2 Tax=Sclerotinia sclerotiorum (strain ATCC 18683 / 1980 / Ss-1) TaxID=665079 RepID=A7E7W4_SCLS1|nr:predicted protein [Sclerotinia sclerotiorum 1980 UF-70]APA06149.1 hypothetical protein sscle_01g009190 [Sclerotinia sclerotiorum 1980 UF-70]EDN96466.1 predicted protein [Sclerotinia sclerotiorum 1980 UF-70]
MTKFKYRSDISEPQRRALCREANVFFLIDEDEGKKFKSKVFMLLNISFDIIDSMLKQIQLEGEESYVYYLRDILQDRWK